jgi:hypothetical protein
VSLLRNLLRVVAHQVIGEPAPRVGEAMARIALYPSSARTAVATTKTAPAARGTPRGLTHRGDVSNEHRQ